MGSKQRPGGSQRLSIRIDRAQASRTVQFAVFAEIFRKRFRWHAHKRTRPLEIHGTAAIMPVQSSQPLDQDIHRRKVGDEPVGIDVEALLQRLGADQKFRPFGRGFAQLRGDRRIQQFAILAGKAAMMGAGDPIDGKEGGQQLRAFLGDGGFDRAEQGIGPAYGVADHQHPRACLERGNEPGDQRLILVQDGASSAVIMRSRADAIGQMLLRAEMSG
jgi:hypothetical protein